MAHIEGGLHVGDLDSGRDCVGRPRDRPRRLSTAATRFACLARGESGPVANGAKLIRADRRLKGAYEEPRRKQWDAVVEISWQPGMVREALAR